LRTFFIFLAFLFSSYSWSGCSGDVCEDVYITELGVSGFHGVGIKVSGNIKNLNCQTFSDTIELYDFSVENDGRKLDYEYKLMYSTLLTAFMADKKVTLETTGEYRVLEICNLVRVSLSR